jgi:hypothetical protein
MTATADFILTQLGIVAHERGVRAASPGIARRVLAAKAYQQRRFSHTYADLLATPRYAGAARFFLEELYGPDDFSQRDAQFARVVPALVRLFPRDVVETVATLARLHALSEQLDTHMGISLAGDHVDAPMYAAAWRTTGRPMDRELQLDLTLSVGRALDELTRKPMLRHTLRMMRGPARAAGLSALQSFLENGFDTFSAMRGASAFLETVDKRERALFAALFDASSPLDAASLGQLP